MSDRQAALLRGINVGKAKRVAMADLRALVASLGYGDVRTLLNSGNVVYGAPGVAPADAAARIEAALVARLGVRSRVVALSAAEVAAIVAGDPFGAVATDPSRYFVTVPYDPAARAALAPLARADWGAERLALGAGVAYQWCPDGLTGSRLAEAVARATRDGATTRNWATVGKLHALLAG